VSFSHAAGTSFYSDTCGGGAYDLSPLGVSDLTTTDANGQVYFNPCGYTKVSYCQGLNASACYVTNPQSSSNAILLSAYNPAIAPVQYQLASNGIYQILEDGTYCNSGGVVSPSIVTTFFVCTPGTAAPAITSYSVVNCQYSLTVSTNITCGTPFGSGGGGSSLSGGAIAGIVIGCVVGVLLILASGYFFFCVLGSTTKKSSNTTATGSKFNEMEESRSGVADKESTHDVEMSEHEGRAETA